MEKRTYFVVGGSSGIGLEIVRKLSNRGNAVYVGSRTSGPLNSMKEVTHIELDVTWDDFDFSNLPESIDGLVYCPGTLRLKPFQRLTLDDFLEDMQVNFLGAVKIIKACLKKLKKSSSGGSILLFSTVAVKTGMPYHSSIASSKAAVEGLTRSLAAEFAPRLRVNAIAPSLTDTPLVANLLTDDEKRQASENRHPLKRIGTPQEIAHLAFHILSESGAGLTGQVFHVDGGMSDLRTFR